MKTISFPWIIRTFYFCDWNRFLKNLFIWLELFIVVGFSGCGRVKNTTLKTVDLPCFKDFSNYGHIDLSSRNITVHVLNKTSYLIGSNFYPTNTIGLSSEIYRMAMLLPHPPPIIIRAKAEAAFGDVWQVVEAGATNSSGFLFAVRIRGSLNKEDFIMFRVSELTNVPSNTVIVACKKDGMSVDKKEYSIKQLESRFAWIKSQNSSVLKVFILINDDCPYQKVVCVLENCYENNINVALGLNSESTKKINPILDMQPIVN